MKTLLILIVILLGLTAKAQKHQNVEVVLITTDSPQALSLERIQTLLKIDTNKKVTRTVTKYTSLEVTKLIQNKLFKRSVKAQVLTLMDPQVQLTTAMIKNKLIFRDRSH